MSDDDMFDRWVADAAAEYHRPPTQVPREEMWAVIQASVAPSSTSDVVPLGPHRWSARRVVPLVAAAALLVVVAYQAGVTRGARVAGKSGGVPPVVTESSPAWDVASRALFDRAEIFLAAARSEPGAAVDPAVTAWARDMLSDTRLLLDSPAAFLPERRALLEALELTLAQVVRLSGAASPEERSLADRSLRGGDLLSRLRASVPAPSPVRGT